MLDIHTVYRLRTPLQILAGPFGPARRCALFFPGLKAEVCRTSQIKAMLMLGVDFDALLTAEAIARARSYVTRHSETGSKFLSPHYAGIDDVKPGDFLGFFRIFGTPIEDPGNREVVRMLEAVKMTRQIDQATLERSSHAPRDVSPSPARRRAAL